MNQLPIEILQDIFAHCPLESILKVSQLNTFFREVVNSKPIWRILLLKLERFSRFPGRLVEDPQRAFRDLYPLSKTGLVDWIPIAKSADFASSIDNPQQSVANVLLNDSSFWSSSGSADVNSNEEVILSLIGLSLVSCVKMKPYRAAYQALSPIYAPQQLQVPITFDVLNTSELQMFDISEFCTLGDSIKLSLLKRQKQQLQDDLWYTVLEKVEIYGIPLNESTPYLTDMIRKECDLLQIIPSFAAEHDMSYSHALKVADSYGNNFKHLYLDIIETPAYGPFRNPVVLSEVWKRHDDYVKNQLQKPIQVAQMEYFELLESRRNRENPGENTWTDFESLEFSKLLIQTNGVELIWRFFGSEIQLTEDIGDLVFESDPELALAIYSERSCMDKILKCLLHLGSLRQAINLLLAARYPQSHFLYLLRQLSLEHAKEFSRYWIDRDTTVWRAVANQLGVAHLTTLESLSEWVSS